jgi:MFS transporter, FHS family, L-fucose permease
MNSQRKSYTIPMIIIGALFFIFGFVTWVNSVLIPYLKIACELSDFESYLVATAFYIAFTIMAVPASLVLKRTGYKKGMSIGLLTMAIGAIIFIPAANTRNFNIFLLGLFVIGTGLALLQTAANPYASVLGPIESAATRISIMGICNKSAGFLSILIFGKIALDDTDGLVARLKTLPALEKAAELDQLAGRVINPYIIITCVLLVLAVAILFSGLPDIKEEAEDKSVPDSFQKSTKTSIFQFPHLLLGVLALFLYVGVEVIAMETVIIYGKSLGIELKIAKNFPLITLTCMTIGYIIGVFTIPKYVSQAMALRVSAILGVIFTIGAVVTSGYTSVTFIILLGLANSLMWPAIFPMAIDGLGQYTKTGAAFLIMGISGGAILPLVYSSLAKPLGTTHAYFVLIPCYLFILYYAVKGYKAGKALA